jgi:hypothetical protein
MMLSKRRSLRLALLAMLAGGALGGCYEDDRYRYLAHSDTVTMGAGDAVAVNKATHTIDPWPPESRNARIDQDGKRAHIAIKRYEANKSIQPRGLTSNSDGSSNGNGGDSGDAAVKK